MYTPTTEVTKRPIHLTLCGRDGPKHESISCSFGENAPVCKSHLKTQPTLTPVKMSQIHQSMVKGLQQQEGIRYGSAVRSASGDPLSLLIVEASEEVDGCECEEEEHRVEEDESRDDEPGHVCAGAHSTSRERKCFSSGPRSTATAVLTVQKEGETHHTASSRRPDASCSS